MAGSNNGEVDWQNRSFAERYQNVENASRPFGKMIVEKSGLVESDGEARVFDLATGTGAAIQELYDAVPKEKWGQLKVLGGDINPVMLDYLNKRAEAQGWPSLETQVIDGRNIKLTKGSYTHIFCNFAIFALPGALPKLYELLKPGGFIGVTTWAHLAWQPLLARSIARMVDRPYTPSSTELELKMSFGQPWGDKDYLVQQLSDAGFERVETERVQIPASTGNPAVFVETMGFVMGMVTAFWPAEKRAAWAQELMVIMLEEATREAGGEDQPVVINFDAHVGWGWKNG